MKDRKKSSSSAGWYGPWWHYENEPETRAAPDRISSYASAGTGRGAFAPLQDTLPVHGEFYMHPADSTSYLCSREILEAWYADPKQWARKAIMNVASSGKLSSDRTIAEYAKEIWRMELCPVS
jgi:starch phosphorylase